MDIWGLYPGGGMTKQDFCLSEPLSRSEAVMAMVKDGEKLIDPKGNIHLWTGCEFVVVNSETHESQMSFQFWDLRRQLGNSKFRMTQNDALAWVRSSESERWMVREWFTGKWHRPQCSECIYGGKGWQRAKLLPDGSGFDWGTFQVFEVEE
jgi:hypothetical protein